MRKAAKTVKTIERHLIENFITLGRYNQPGPKWPTGEGSAILLSKVKILSQSYLTGTKWDRIYINPGKAGEHPERAFVNDLGREIQDSKYQRGKYIITAHLVQSYSPCWECAEAFMKFKNKHKGIQFFLTIEFANFYRHWENKNWLQKLSKNGVALKLLHGENMWRAFLDDERMELDEKEKLQLLDRARSEERKKKEKKALEIYREFELGNTTQPSGIVKSNEAVFFVQRGMYYKSLQSMVFRAIICISSTIRSH